MNKDSDQKAIFEAAACWVARHDAGLSAAEVAEFVQWRSADTRHEVAFEYCSRAWSALDRPLLADEKSALVRELRARTLRRQARRRRTRRVQIAAAATCAVVVIAFASLWQRRREIMELPPFDALPASVVTASSEETVPAHPRQSIVTVISPEQRELPDGSMVEIRQGAVIDMRYDDTVRRVVLVSGEAYFQVAKELSRPFVVAAGDIEVRAVGTAFSVDLGNEQTEVLVTEGCVAVEKPASQPDTAMQETITAADVDAQKTSTPKPAIDSTAGPVLVATLGMRERLVVETAAAADAPVLMAVTPDEINERLAWRVSRLEFSATPLAEAVALINSHSQLPDGSANTRLVMDESLSDMKAEPVSGYFPASDIAAFVDVLHVSMGIASERRGDVIILRKEEIEPEDEAQQRTED
ncbi:MAG: FecR domain-containing protein [Opitutaceae bacterium]|jgi:transmembrane sensor|nr:FecR domain-containing protein [Opitutaceae bacterium]